MAGGGGGGGGPRGGPGGGAAPARGAGGGAVASVPGVPPVKVQLHEVALVERSVKVTESPSQTSVSSAEKPATGFGSTVIYVGSVLVSVPQSLVTVKDTA